MNTLYVPVPAACSMMFKLSGMQQKFLHTLTKSANNFAFLQILSRMISRFSNVVHDYRIWRRTGKLRSASKCYRKLRKHTFAVMQLSFYSTAGLWTKANGWNTAREVDQKNPAESWHGKNVK
jgi:hypothetical protein